MEIYEAWNRAAKNTEIIRTRIQSLMTFQDTHVPYVILSESSINVGDTVVRKGDVVVQKPQLILPPNVPQFEGFELEENYKEEENSIINFLLVRGVTLPSLKYNNKTHSLDIFEGKLPKAVKYYQEFLQHKENVHTGQIVGPEDCWQFSLLIFIYSQVSKNAETDIKKLIKQYNQDKEKE